MSLGFEAEEEAEADDEEKRNVAVNEDAENDMTNLAGDEGGFTLSLSQQGAGRHDDAETRGRELAGTSRKQRQKSAMEAGFAIFEQCQKS